MVYESYDDLLKLLSAKTFSADDLKNFTRLIRERIQPFNIAGLLNPAAKNMYHHTVAVF
jgi:FADH2 O2-dependent halogenase